MISQAYENYGPLKRIINTTKNVSLEERHTSYTGLYSDSIKTPIWFITSEQ